MSNIRTLSGRHITRQSCLLLIKDRKREDYQSTLPHGIKVRLTDRQIGRVQEIHSK
ncbi:DUF2196 domain-containing protein [Lysinibacillus xylanilyticus]|uniref:DUF2196 domain-containing protein n=1 Tax=Lysinibacillus xylanilyticus TaxID=582475 RepID=UPI003814154B